MKIDIWSDIRCPFCYIGKRNLEKGLEKFEHNDQVKMVWHSFQLDPTLKNEPGKNVYDYLAEKKGQSREWSVQMHNQVTRTAQEAGLDFNFENSVIANSFDAHRLIQCAKTQQLGDAAEERLFKAYFTEGLNIADQKTLIQLGVEIGLDETAIEQVLGSDAFTEEVRNDEAIAQSIGIRGVPFFVFNDQYSISGAQPVEAFLQTLQHAWKEYEVQQSPVSDQSTANQYK
ncbi:MAG: DsbA family oxidoreductase [Chitinophagaceae bacterium]